MKPITQKKFGTTSDGKEVTLYTLENENGISIDIIDYGAALVSIKVPDKNGSFLDILLGYASIEGYEKQDKYLGVILGRCANRIEKGCFTLNNKNYHLFCNDGKNHLHGGKIGFDKKLWTGKITDNTLSFFYNSPDGEEGYPGNLEVQVSYILTETNDLILDYRANSDQDTVCNLSNHAYFNLGGHASGTILNQYVQIFSAYYTHANKESLPDGHLESVKDTPMDFRQPKQIGLSIEEEYDQLQWAKGYDQNWVLDQERDGLKKAALAFHPTTGICIELSTTMPGLQFYTGNFLEGAPEGKEHTFYKNRTGFCFESQYYPNALKHNHFPQPILKKEKPYHHTSVFHFGIWETNNTK